MNGARAAQAISEWLLHRGHVRANSPAAFIVAVTCVAVSTLLRLVLGSLLGADITPFATYYPAVLIAAIVGGAGAGFLALLLGGLAAWWTFIPPYFSLQISSQSHLVSLMLYLVAGAVIVWLSEAYRGAVHRVRDEEARRLLLLRELQHRNSNTLAVVQAIASDALRHDPASADAIVRRLGAYVRSNDLLTQSDDRTLDLRAIVAGEFEPYGTERVALDGPPLQLSAEITSTLALIFHELATNAAKYGALSVPAGRLCVTWRRADGRLQVTWAERNGPPVEGPLGGGFGTQLVERLLRGFGGKMTLDVGADGLTYTISVVAAEEG